MSGFVSRNLWIAGLGIAAFSAIPDRFKLVLLIFFVFGPLMMWLPSGLSWIAILPVLWIAVNMQDGWRGRWRFARRYSLGEKVLIFAFACGFLFLAFLGGQYNSGRTEDLLREQFHVPHDVEFVEVRYPSRGTANHVEGIVQFTKAQLADYYATMSNRELWKQTGIGLDRLDVKAPFSPRAIEWTKLPKPIFAGTRRVRWGNLSRKEAQEAKSGAALCIALRLEPANRKSDWWRPAPKGYEHMFPFETPSHLTKYNAINCAEMGRSERPKAYILGLLDFDTRRLHMIIR